MKADGPDVEISGVENFNLSDTLDCGQCFRFEQTTAGIWNGPAYGHLLSVSQQEDTLRFYHTSPALVRSLWVPYLDLGRDYQAVLERARQFPVLRESLCHAGGIRILRQQPWEALCSFILSQNNNIPRIKGIIRRLCEGFGEPLEGGMYTFPSAERLAGCSLTDLEPLRSGFRAKYVLDAAQKVASGEVNLKQIFRLPLEDARRTLMTIHGVGPKVAECALLYGFGRMEAFPMDVWMKRAMAQYFPQGLPQELVPDGGIVQQYLFHTVRTQQKTG
ncbi:MAG: DNA glycosylase [Clostridiales bacterium]|nr:DNA glycosylase [Clostridiales bacterium]